MRFNNIRWLRLNLTEAEAEKSLMTAMVNTLPGNDRYMQVKHDSSKYFVEKADNSIMTKQTVLAVIKRKNILYILYKRDFVDFAIHDIGHVQAQNACGCSLKKKN